MDDIEDNKPVDSGDEPIEKKPVKKKKSKAKIEKEDEVLVKNTIEINPKLDEAVDKTVILGWGRMNPITVGHEKLVNKIKSVARKNSAVPKIYISHTQDAKKNPLEYDDKIMLAKKAFGNAIIEKSKSKTIIQIMQELQSKYSKVILVVGQDRIKQFDELLNKYNGKDYKFNSIEVVSAGDRDPDADDVTGMSASKMRAMAVKGDLKAFKTGLPRKLQGDAQDIYDMVRGGMKIAEQMELDEAVLTVQQRRSRGITMRKYKNKIAAARKRLMNKAATMSMLKSRARKAAIKIIRKKIAGKKGENYNKLSPSEKMLIDKRVAKKKGAIDKIAKKILPSVRKADLARLSSKKSANEQFEESFGYLFEEPTVGQDKDIAGRKGTQPAVYHKGLAKSTKVKRDAHFKKGSDMDDDNPAAYKPAPGDAEAKTKLSKHTKKYNQMYGEDFEPHMMYDPKTGKGYKADKEEDHLRMKKMGYTHDKPVEEQKNCGCGKTPCETYGKVNESFEEFMLNQQFDEVFETPKVQRFHQMFKKDGKIKLDARFRAFKKKNIKSDDDADDTTDEIQEITIKTDAERTLKRQHKDERQNLKRDHEREMDGLLTRELRKKVRQVNNNPVEEFISDSDLISFIEETSNDILDQVLLDEAKGEEGLKKKAEKSGMPLGILRKVYNRGIAAWRTGHRPGTTPQQWGFARVNSFITKQSGTWGKADKDLAAKVRKEEVNLEEKLSVSDGLGAWIDDFKKSDAPQFAGKSDKKKQQMAVAAFVDAGGKLEEGAVSPAQRAAIAISKKEKAGKPGYDSEGKAIKEDDPCWDSHEQRGMKKKNGKLVPNCVPKNESVNESFEKLFTEKSPAEMIKGKLGLKLYKKQYQHALKTLKDLIARKKKESSGPRGSMRHDVGYYAAQIARSYQNVDSKLLAKMVTEEGGAGDKGTDKVTKRYKKDTPGEAYRINEDFEEMFNEDVTQKQLNDLEKFADRLLDKFGIDIEFTRHFADRMNDDRNKPAISIAELQRVFKKIAKNKAKNIRQNPDIEAVLKDIQADLNLPIVINYDSEKDEYEVVNKTIMRKKNFGTSSKVIKV